LPGIIEDMLLRILFSLLIIAAIFTAASCATGGETPGTPPPSSPPEGHSILRPGAPYPEWKAPPDEIGISFTYTQVGGKSITHFNIERRTCWEGSWEMIGQVEAEQGRSSYEFVDTDFPPDSFVQYRVQASNGENESEYSEPSVVQRTLYEEPEECLPCGPPGG
jgi:hypothetical protein